MYLDTHCHLALSQFDGDRNEILAGLKDDSDLAALVEVSVDYESTKKMLDLFGSENLFYFGLGMHPHSAENFEETLFDYYRELIESNNRIIAVGEIGLDSKSPVDFNKQYEVYSKCVEFARSVNKPIIVHSRGYDDEILKPLKEHGASEIVFHCYSSDKEMAKLALDQGAYLSFSGIVTFPSAKDVREAAKYVPMDRILAETDSPYLAPQNVRGQRNSPDRVKDVIAFLADIKGVSVTTMSDAILKNATNAFSLPI